MSRASPRNLSTSPPWRSVIPIRPSKNPETASVSSSAPARPFACSRSERAVKPERSTETSVPSSSRTPSPPSRLQSSTSRDKYGAKEGTFLVSNLALETSSKQDYCELSASGGGILNVLRRRWVIWVAFVSAALALPGVAQAHGDANYSAPGTLSAPTVDGVVNGGEWEEAPAYSVVFGSLGNATVRFLHTATDLYVGVVVTDATPGVGPSFSVYFDDNHNGEKEQGEDAWLSGNQDFFWDADGPGSSSHYHDSV